MNNIEKEKFYEMSVSECFKNNPNEMASVSRVEENDVELFYRLFQQKYSLVTLSKKPDHGYVFIYVSKHKVEN